MQSRDDYTIYVGVKTEDLATPVVNSLKPLNCKVFLGDNYPSFSKLINDIIVDCPTEIVIFCSHKVIATPDDISKLLERIDGGYGISTVYRFGCFGFKKDLIRQIGFFDERYLNGGWEDNDIMMRLLEADISYYEDESAKYIPGASLWKHPPGQLKSQVHYRKKWSIYKIEIAVRNLDEEIYPYDIGKSTLSKFKPWSESVFCKVKQVESFNGAFWNPYLILSGDQPIQNKHILIFGGTGSLGHKFVEIYGMFNNITIFSRDENKHWQMNLTFPKTQYPGLKYYMGDIRDKDRVRNAIYDTDPDIIIIASALKHIDLCEYEVSEAIATNYSGTENVLMSIKDNWKRLTRLTNVLFVSTDKACHPINTYGMAKALSEKATVEMAKKMKDLSCPIKFNVVRYGNILNSRGSIIEILNRIGTSSQPHFVLTHEQMTRFIMLQEQSVKMITYALTFANSGDIVVPKIKSILIKHLIEIFAMKYNKKILITGIRPGEKMHEILFNTTEYLRIVDDRLYYRIRPTYDCDYKSIDHFKNMASYESFSFIMEKEELMYMLKRIGL